jgi:hypothetical protein
LHLRLRNARACDTHAKMLTTMSASGTTMAMPAARGPATRAVRAAAAAAACRPCAVAPARGSRLAAGRGAAAQLRASPVVVVPGAGQSRVRGRSLRVVAAAAAAGGDKEPNEERALVRFTRTAADARHHTCPRATKPPRQRGSGGHRAPHVLRRQQSDA